MRKSMRYLLVTGFALATQVFAPTASATSGDPMPVPPVPGTPREVCTVLLQAAERFDGNQVVGHSEYSAVTVSWTCVDADGAVHSYDVNAGGDLWGPTQIGGCQYGFGVCEGSSDVLAWTDNSAGSYSNGCGLDDTANMSRISANDAYGTAWGWMKFVRLATHITAWGDFCDGTGRAAGRSFDCELEYVQQNPFAGRRPGEWVLYDLRGICTFAD